MVARGMKRGRRGDETRQKSGGLGNADQVASIRGSAGQNANLVLQDLVDKPMLLVDPPGPTAGEFVLQWLRLAKSAERVALNVTNKPDNANCLRRQIPSFSTTASSEIPSWRCFAARR